MESISITVPMNHEALSAAAKMLTELADNAMGNTTSGSIKPPPTLKSVEQREALVADADAMESVKVGKEYTIPSLQGKWDAAIELAAAARSPQPPTSWTAPQDDETETNTVDVDASGLPWDARIHSSSRSFLAKSGNWKLRRGIDPALVERVEADLKSAMGAPAAAAEVSQGGPVAPPPPPYVGVAKPEITTFPEFVIACTTAGIDPEDTNAACVAAGIPSVPLLATRPDLIPQVAQALGL